MATLTRSHRRTAPTNTDRSAIDRNMASKPPDYPFTPKSTSFLKPGMIWDIALRDGSYACGRVLCVEGKHRKRRTNLFWGALLQWHRKTPPTVDEISGAPVLWQGDFNVRSFRGSESKILALLPLEADGIKIPPILPSLLGTEIMIGYDIRRPATDEEFRSLPVKTVEVGNDSFREIAEDVFLDGKPMRWARSPDANHLLNHLGIETPSDIKNTVAKIGRRWTASRKVKNKRSKN